MKLPRQKAARAFEQARSLLAKGDAAACERLVAEVLEASDLPRGPLIALRADALLALGERERALALFREALAEDPEEPQLNAGLGNALVKAGRAAEGVGYLAKASKALRKDPAFAVNYGHALVQAGRNKEGREVLSRAAAGGGGPTARLFLALAHARLGEFAQAEEACLRVEKAAPALKGAADDIRAECRLFQGDAAGALALWQGLRAAGALQPEHLSHMACAAQLVGERALADVLLGERLAAGASAEDLLFAAEISNLRQDGAGALASLERAAEVAGGGPQPGFELERLAAKARALTLLGRREEAGAALREAAALPEAQSTRLGARIQLELAALAESEGRLPEAAELFGRALALDPKDPEATAGVRRLVERFGNAFEHDAAEPEASAGARRLGARFGKALEPGAQAGAPVPVEALPPATDEQAAAEGLRRRFVARERELEALRRELEELKEARRQAEQRAEAAQAEARRSAASGVRAELETREAEISEKARQNLDRALGEAATRCPPALLRGLLVAEQTFQKALYTELPAAAVAVLYAGALERALFVLFVERFQRWLAERGRLEAFLTGAIRERRGKRVDYFDNFVEAFDQERPGRAPSLGEVGRVLERRQEPYLAPFRAFLEESYAVPDAFYEKLAAFISWSKVKLRDPVAHGRAIEMGYEELRRFREELLYSLGGSGKGVLAALLAARTE